LDEDRENSLLSLQNSFNYFCISEFSVHHGL
jgi:hypothetical protein